jgi:hypothetical protein
VVCTVCEQVEGFGFVLGEICNVGGSFFEIAVEHLVEVKNSGADFGFVEPKEDSGRADIDIDHLGANTTATREF